MLNSLDVIDRRILKALQQNGRLQNIELAEKVGLSPSPCLRRVKLLEERGVIQRYVALIDPEKVGKSLSVYVRIWLNGQGQALVEQFTDEIQQMSEVVECHLMAGDCDFLLRVVAGSLDDYRQFQINKLSKISCVQNIKTEIPLQKIKLTSELPV